MSAIRYPSPTVREVLDAFPRAHEVTIKQIRDRFGCSYHSGRELRDLVVDIARRTGSDRVASVMREHRMSEVEARDFIAMELAA
jgi:hypothetical protein